MHYSASWTIHSDCHMLQHSSNHAVGVYRHLLALTEHSGCAGVLDSPFATVLGTNLQIHCQSGVIEIYVPLRVACAGRYAPGSSS